MKPPHEVRRDQRHGRSVTLSYIAKEFPRVPGPRPLAGSSGPKRVPLHVLVEEVEFQLDLTMMEALVTGRPPG